MAYTQYNATKPDPTTDNGTVAFTNTRSNLQALRDAIIGCIFSGWDATFSTGTASEPGVCTFSDGGNERVKVTITYGSSGVTDGKITNLLVEYSSNGGSSYDTIDTTPISYDASGNITSASGAAVIGLMFFQNLGARLATHEAVAQAHGAAVGATPNTLCFRNSAGNIGVSAPLTGSECVNKTWHENTGTAFNAGKVGGRTITSGTGAPSGGADGDIHFQHEA